MRTRFFDNPLTFNIYIYNIDIRFQNVASQFEGEFIVAKYVYKDGRWKREGSFPIFVISLILLILILASSVLKDNLNIFPSSAAREFHKEMSSMSRTTPTSSGKAVSYHNFRYTTDHIPGYMITKHAEEVQFIVHCNHRSGFSTFKVSIEDRVSDTIIAEKEFSKNDLSSVEKWISSSVKEYQN